jgi:peptidyl-prolyl cis-trans isomerase SurA
MRETISRRNTDDSHSRCRASLRGIAIITMALVASSTLFLHPSRAEAEVVERIAAVVNEDVILLSRVRERAIPVIAAAEQQSRSLSKAMPPTEHERIFKRVLYEMVDEVLVNEQASKMRIRIGSQEVDRALKNMARQNSLTWPNFVRAVEAQGYSLSQYRTDLRRQLLRFKVVQAKLQGRLRVSDREVKSYYVRQVRRARAGDRCRLSHILVKVEPEAGAAGIAQRRRRSRAILERVEAGAPFDALAKRYSEDERSASRGGNLGWVDSYDLPDDVRDIVLGLGAGEVDGPIRTTDGFRLLKVLEWEASDVRPFTDVRETIRLRLLEEQMEQQERVWLAELRRKAYVDVRLWR